MYSVLRPRRFGGAAFAYLMTLTLCPCVAIDGQEPDRLGDTLPMERWVDRLGSPSFAERQRSAERLLAATIAGGQSGSGERVIAALRSGLSDPSVEVRLACQEILEAVQQRKLDRQVQLLLDPFRRPEAIEVAGWQVFREVAGTDFAARSMFARILTRRPTFAQQLHRVDADRLLDMDVGPQDRFLPTGLDPHAIQIHDSVSWAMVLTWQQIGRRGSTWQGLSLSESLARGETRPIPQTLSDALVVRRLVARWLASQPLLTDRCRLRIALRYHCDESAAGLCAEILQNPAAPAIDQSAAMLAASTLARTELLAELKNRLDDARPAHPWRLLPARRQRIETKVSDVALALLLHHHGIDPRDAGFEQLEADPHFLFREETLGFPDQASRRQTYRRASQLLSQRGE